MTVVNDGRNTDCIIIDDYNHYTSTRHARYDASITKERSMYAQKGTSTILQKQTNDDHTKIHLFNSLSCVSIFLVSPLSRNHGLRRDYLTQEHAARVFDVFLDLEGFSLKFPECESLKAYLDKECDGFPAIKETVVISESEVHHLNVMSVGVQHRSM